MKTTVAIAKKRERNAIKEPQWLRKANGRFVITIPEEEIIQQGIEAGR